jgi:hypothetical protein
MPTFELNDDQLNDIILHDLSMALDALECEQERGTGGVYAWDTEEDRMHIQKRIDAIKLVMEYYGGTAVI